MNKRGISGKAKKKKKKKVAQETGIRWVFFERLITLIGNQARMVARKQKWSRFQGGYVLKHPRSLPLLLLLALV